MITFRFKERIIILQNLEKLAQEDHQIIVRVPVIPGITDSEENIHNIGTVLARLPGIDRVDLLPYHPAAKGKYDHLQKHYQLAEMTSPNEDHLAKLASSLKHYGLQVKIGG